MRIGFDFHNVLDAYPNQISQLIAELEHAGNFVCIISAIGPRRVGTIAEEVRLCGVNSYYTYEVVFKHPSQSPALKVAKALELKLDMFFDDRQDICDAMNAAGTLCFKVPRRSNLSDIQAEIK